MLNLPRPPKSSIMIAARIRQKLLLDHGSMVSLAHRISHKPKQPIPKNQIIQWQAITHSMAIDDRVNRPIHNRNTFKTTVYNLKPR